MLNIVIKVFAFLNSLFLSVFWIFITTFACNKAIHNHWITYTPWILLAQTHNELITKTIIPS